MVRRLPVVALALGLLLAGCGGREEKNAYVDELNKAQTGFAADVKALGRPVTATSTPEQDRRALTSYRRVVERTVARLETIEVPGDVTDLHRRLIGEFQRYDVELRRLRERVQTTDVQVATRAQVDFYASADSITKQITTTIEQLNSELRG